MSRSDFKTLIRSAVWFTVYDEATEYLKRNAGDREAQYVAVLSLLQGGALETARRLYVRFGLDGHDGDEDSIALGGRIYKDLSQVSKGAKRAANLRKSLSFYERAYAVSGGIYPLINMATLAYLCGDYESAKTRSELILTLTTFDQEDLKLTDKYWHHASRAEAFLICGDGPACEDEFRNAAEADSQNFAARASTIRQFERLFAAGAPQFDLSGFRPSGVLHFCGHIYGGASQRQLSEAQVTALNAEIDRFLKANPTSEGFGALAAGSDILLAEALLANGADLHIVLPVPADLFRRASITPFGKDWDKRYQACLNAATSVTVTNPDAITLDELEIALASQIAMGKACLRAAEIAAPVRQVAISDGGPVRRAGTALDIKIWAEAGRPQTVLDWPKSSAISHVAEPKNSPFLKRQMASMLFADLVGFSRLPDAAQPAVIEAIMRPLAEQVIALPAQAKIADSWGDGIFLAYDDPKDAALAALSLQSRFASLLSQLPEPLSELSLRIGGHCGPVYSGQDPFRRKDTIYGRNVVTASRIEPLTLPGSIFISEPMACLLTAFQADTFKCDYVGMMHPEKNHPPIRLFSLRPAAFL